MNYINSSYYYNTFGGEIIPQEKFNKYATIASNKVRTAIFNRDISLFETEVKNATCSVAEILYNQELNKQKLNNVVGGGEMVVTSEKVGDYSRTISGVSTTELKEFSSNSFVDKQIQDTLEDYLFYTGLLYVGVACV